MTVFEFHPKSINEDDCLHTYKEEEEESPWCLVISDCLSHYMNRFNDIKCEEKLCEWPLTEYQFKYYKTSKCYKSIVKDFDTYTDYLATNPLVEYYTDIEGQFYGLVNTDGTLNFAYQNSKCIFIVHITNMGFYDGEWHEGFGCIINKFTNEIHCVRLGEDDGYYWGDHDIPLEDMFDWEWMYVTQVVNDMDNKLFWDKEKLIEKIFNLARSNK